MPSYSNPFPSPGTGLAASLQLALTEQELTPEDIAANRSRVTYDAFIRRDNTGGTGTFNLEGCTAALDLNNSTIIHNTNHGYDFRSSSGQGAVGATVAIGSGTIDVTHDDDGSKSLPFSLSYVDDGALIGNTSLAGSLALASIPRGPRVRHAGSWKNTVLYVRHAGSWKIAVLYTRTNGTWKVAA
jgi:hypothetical protein